MSGAVDDVAQAFLDSFGYSPDGVWSAPGRVNVIGEHTDYNEGLCLPLALPQRTYVAAARREDDLIRLRSVQTGDAWEGRLSDIGPGTPAGWAAYPAGVLWALAGQGVAVGGVDLVLDGRVPLGAGLSSSAALTCSTACAAADLYPTPPRAIQDLIDAAMTAENVVAGAATGGLDQTASLRAVPGHVLLLDFQSGQTEPVPWRPDDSGWELLVCDTRAPHSLNDGAYAQRRAQCEEAAGLLGVRSLREVPAGQLAEALDRLPNDVLRRRTRHVVTEIQRVVDAVAALRADDVAALGAAMSASHASLRDDYEVTVPELDVAVEAAGAAGGIGARMTGGGFGGSVIVLVRVSEREQVMAAIESAFDHRGFTPPAFLSAPASGPGGRDV